MKAISSHRTKARSISPHNTSTTCGTVTVTDDTDGVDPADPSENTLLYGVVILGILSGGAYALTR